MNYLVEKVDKKGHNYSVGDDSTLQRSESSSLNEEEDKYVQVVSQCNSPFLATMKRKPEYEFARNQFPPQIPTMFDYGMSTPVDDTKRPRKNQNLPKKITSVSCYFNISNFCILMKILSNMVL